MTPANISATQDRPSRSPLDTVEPFLGPFTAAGDATARLRNKRTGARAVARWLQRRRVNPT